MNAITTFHTNLDIYGHENSAFKSSMAHATNHMLQTSNKISYRQPYMSHVVIMETKRMKKKILETQKRIPEQCMYKALAQYRKMTSNGYVK